jgi:hypothetical protein
MDCTVEFITDTNGVTQIRSRKMSFGDAVETCFAKYLIFFWAGLSV